MRERRDSFVERSFGDRRRSSLGANVVEEITVELLASRRATGDGIERTRSALGRRRELLSVVSIEIQRVAIEREGILAAALHDDHPSK